MKKSRLESDFIYILIRLVIDSERVSNWKTTMRLHMVHKAVNVPKCRVDELAMSSMELNS